jgi:hypothetical protein
MNINQPMEQGTKHLMLRRLREIARVLMLMIAISALPSQVWPSNPCASPNVICVIGVPELPGDGTGGGGSGGGGGSVKGQPLEGNAAEPNESLEGEDLALKTPVKVSHVPQILE